MPRDGTKNLKSMAMRSKEEVKEIARKGGINSGIARRKKKSMKEALELLLELEVSDVAKAGYAKKGLNVETNEDAIAAAMIMQAKKGNTSAYSEIAKVRGENKQQIEVNSANDKFAEVLEAWTDKRSGTE